MWSSFLLTSLAIGVGPFGSLANASLTADAPLAVIIKDVAIIGGGVTGTYAAVRLREDFKKSVVVVECEDHLGGHTNTYVVPGTNVSLEYGVQVYNSLPSTFALFARFDVPVETTSAPPFVNKYVDFTSGKAVVPAVFDNPFLALHTDAQLLQKYPYLTGGYDQLPDPRPAELLEPFSKFVSDNHLEAGVSTIWPFVYSVGDLNATTLCWMQNFNLAAGLLGGDVLYSSTVKHIFRDQNGCTTLIVSTPTGKKIIKAKKVLITIPPTLEKMNPFDLDDQEKSVFKKWKWFKGFAAIVSNTGPPDGLNIINTDAETSFNLPKLPFIVNYYFTGFPGKYWTQVLGNQNLYADAAKKLITDDPIRIGTAGTLPTNQNPVIDAFTSNTPLQLLPSPGDLKAGFYKDLYALQGHRAGDHSSILW